jgi:outer membrane protein assembly factor BamA
LSFPLLFLIAAVPAFAQTAKVVGVKVTGSARFTSEQIAPVSEIRPGDMVSRDDIQAAADHLGQIGRFLNVRYRFNSRGQDVEVEFQLEDAPAFPVSFDNFPWFTDEEIVEALKQSVPLFDGTAPGQGAILEAMKGTLDELLQRRGVTAVVEFTELGRADGDGMMMQFRAVGASMRVAAVQFSDPLAQESRRVRERLDDIVGKPYSRFAAELFLREQVRPIYFERGHLRVHFGRPEARFTGDPNKPLPDQVTLVVSIEPGPAYNWAGAEWSGIAAFGAEPLNATLALTIGELANGNKIHAALERVRGEYTSRGYLDVDIQAEPEFSESEAGGIRLYKALYRINVTEGAVYRMGELIVTGLSVTGERRLIAAWKIPGGEYFNQLLFEDFVRRLESQNERSSIFGDLPIHYDEVGRWLRKNPETRAVDVLFDFK